LAQQYPHAKDPQYQGVHAVGTRENIAMFRDGLLNHLKTRGTTAACGQIHRIVGQLPHLSWIKWVILEAEENTRRKTWQPPTPEQIIKLA